YFHPDGHSNAFMVYRKLFVETARSSCYNLAMNIISNIRIPKTVKSVNKSKKYQQLESPISEFQATPNSDL
ncbi:14371_t:CDS:2, partial [Racocetra persica]